MEMKRNDEKNWNEKIEHYYTTIVKNKWKSKKIKLIH